MPLVRVGDAEAEGYPGLRQGLWFRAPGVENLPLPAAMTNYTDPFTKYGFQQPIKTVRSWGFTKQ